jgi:hypothetical protein
MGRGRDRAAGCLVPLRPDALLGRGPIWAREVRDLIRDTGRNSILGIWGALIGLLFIAFLL